MSVPLNAAQQEAVRQANSATNPMVVLFALLLLVVFFLPTVMAIHRRQPNTGIIVLCNIFLGWTVIGWVVALNMAMRRRSAV